MVQQRTAPRGLTDELASWWPLSSSSAAIRLIRRQPIWAAGARSGATCMGRRGFDRGGAGLGAKGLTAGKARGVVDEANPSGAAREPRAGF